MLTDEGGPGESVEFRGEYFWAIFASDIDRRVVLKGGLDVAVRWVGFKWVGACGGFFGVGPTIAIRVGIAIEGGGEVAGVVLLFPQVRYAIVVPVDERMDS